MAIDAHLLEKKRGKSCNPKENRDKKMTFITRKRNKFTNVPTLGHNQKEIQECVQYYNDKELNIEIRNDPNREPLLIWAKIWPLGLAVGIGVLGLELQLVPFLSLGLLSLGLLGSVLAYFGANF